MAGEGFGRPDASASAVVVALAAASAGLHSANADIAPITAIAHAQRRARLDIANASDGASCTRCFLHVVGRRELRLVPRQRRGETALRAPLRTIAEKPHRLADVGLRMAHVAGAEVIVTGRRDVES